MSDYALFIAVFLACLVEAVEATTIVLAAGTARDWRSATYGLVTGLIALAVIVVVFGPAISLLPLAALRLVVGGLLLVFGLQWMRKAILRASGYKAPHDEDAIYRREVAEARAAARGGRHGVDDWYAFTLSFKGVLLEGLEVAFIVLTFGTIQHRIPEAALAAAIAVVIVAIAGIAVRKPLARVPENTMKFIVGVMLTSFGIFWGAEGAGANWPGADGALLVIIPSVAVGSLLLVAILGRRHRAIASAVVAPASVAVGVHAGSATAAAVVADDELEEPTNAEAPSGAAAAAASAPHVRRTVGSSLLAFWAFLYDFIVGDDWQITAGIVLAFAVTALVSAAPGAWWVVPIAVLALLPYGTLRAIRAH